jgi:hypothetical protein
LRPKIGRGVWVPAFAGTTAEFDPRTNLNLPNSLDIRALWFETRGVAVLLTMRNWQTSS